MEKIKLVEPSLKYEDQVMKIREDFLNNKENFAGCAMLEDCDNYLKWIDFDNRLSSILKDGYVKSHVYLGVRESDNKVVGIIDCRMKLTDFLLKYGGNIGYSVSINERRKGYGKEMLRLLLLKCKDEFLMDKVLITCDKENIASKKTILSNGGVLENEIIDDVGMVESGIIERYWIRLREE